jgi:hypothetical protein
MAGQRLAPIRMQAFGAYPDNTSGIGVTCLPARRLPMPPYNVTGKRIRELPIALDELA